MTKEDMILEKIRNMLTGAYNTGFSNETFSSDEMARELLAQTNAYASGIVNEAVQSIKPAYCTETETMVDKTKVLMVVTARLKI